MNRKVAKFADDETGEGSVDLSGAGRREEWMVHVIGDVGGEAPIVDAVLEQIANWHGRVRESMNENRLEQSLGVVDCVTGRSDTKKLIIAKIYIVSIDTFCSAQKFLLTVQFEKSARS